ncbi:MAG: RluA family pseudouridine synthase [Desulfobacterales bacterium]|nr:RluA family pseudouridine synthase [Desulfobacterales bacterium]
MVEAFEFIANSNDEGKRLDVVVASHIINCTRSKASLSISKGLILVDGICRKQSYNIKMGNLVQGEIFSPDDFSFSPEAINLDIIYEDKDILVINKPPNLVIHPAPGHYSGTLVNGLIYYCAEIKEVGDDIRPGIVHRLDKDTSGCIVVTKNIKSHLNLSLQFKERHIKKYYLALVFGEIQNETGEINSPIGRHPTDRKKMSINAKYSRSAKTFWKIREKIKKCTLLEVEIATGRTHQIRVHFSSINHPIVGDLVYSNVNSEIQKKAPRQMLHAWRIEFFHPCSGELINFEAPMPNDMKNLIEYLRK